jgi:hypothetical protein
MAGLGVDEPQVYPALPLLIPVGPSGAVVVQAAAGRCKWLRTAGPCLLPGPMARRCMCNRRADWASGAGTSVSLGAETWSHGIPQAAFRASHRGHGGGTASPARRRARAP